jgi:hypothetical protein
MSGQCHALAAPYPRYPLDRRLGGPQSWSGLRGYRKNPLRVPGIEPRSSILQSDTTLSYRSTTEDSVTFNFCTFRVLTVNFNETTRRSVPEGCHLQPENQFRNLNMYSAQQMHEPLLRVSAQKLTGKRFSVLGKDADLFTCCRQVTACKSGNFLCL